MARNQEKKTPVIVVKKRRVISPPVVDKTETVIPPVPEVAAPPAAADAQLPAPIPDASPASPAPAAVGKKRKGKEDHHADPSESTGHGSSPTSAWKRSRRFSRIFALKAAVFCLSGSVSPAIFLPGWLSTLKPDSPGMNGTVPYPVSGVRLENGKYPTLRLFFVRFDIDTA